MGRAARNRAAKAKRRKQQKATMRIWQAAIDFACLTNPGAPLPVARTAYRSVTGQWPPYNYRIDLERSVGRPDVKYAERMYQGWRAWVGERDPQRLSSLPESWKARQAQLLRGYGL